MSPIVGIQSDIAANDLQYWPNGTEGNAAPAWRAQQGRVDAPQQPQCRCRNSKIRLIGDGLPAHKAEVAPLLLQPQWSSTDPDTRLYVGDSRDVLANLPDRGAVDLIFADPPFNWDVPYDGWSDDMTRIQYERFTFDWLDRCVDALAPAQEVCGSTFQTTPLQRL